MDYCTPKNFFDKLNNEFHFVLDAAATNKSAKWKKYFTPKDDGLNQSWIYHGQKVSKGRHSIRRQRYSIRQGNVVLFNGQKYISKGCGSYGTQVLLDIGKSVSIKKVQIIRHTGGWINLNIWSMKCIHPPPPDHCFAYGRGTLHCP